MARLLLVEDDKMMGQAVKVALSQAGYVVDLVTEAEDAEAALEIIAYDAIVLDINLPGKSGLELAKDLRSRGRSIPILALTARDTTKQKVEGLNVGMDDYLVKPFELEELLARVRAILRRGHGKPARIIKFGLISLNIEEKIVLKNDEPVSLSAREFAVLAVLMGTPGRLFNKQEIEDKLYGWDVEIESNAIEVHISHLRKKLGDKFIRTVRGMGYCVEKVS